MVPSFAFSEGCTDLSGLIKVLRLHRTKIILFSSLIKNIFLKNQILLSKDPIS